MKYIAVKDLNIKNICRKCRLRKKKMKHDSQR